MQSVHNNTEMDDFSSQEMLSRTQLERMRISEDGEDVDDVIFNLYADNIANEEGTGKMMAISTIPTCNLIASLNSTIRVPCREGIKPRIGQFLGDRPK